MNVDRNINQRRLSSAADDHTSMEGDVRFHADAFKQKAVPCNNYIVSRSVVARLYTHVEVTTRHRAS